MISWNLLPVLECTRFLQVGGWLVGLWNMTALHAGACFHPAAAGCMSTDTFLLADTINTRTSESDWSAPWTDDSLAACPRSLLLKKRILCSDLVFLLMFYDGVPCDHVHHGSDSGPAFLFWLLVLTSTLQLHKRYSGQWLHISRLAPKVMLVMFKLVRSMLLWDKMGLRNQVPSFKKQRNKNYSVSRF